MMLFNNDEKLNFNFLSILIDSLNSNYQIIEENFKSPDNETIDFDGNLINYERFKDNFRYVFIYVDEVLSGLDSKKLGENQLNIIKERIIYLNSALIENLSKNYDLAESYHAFSLTFLSNITSFLNDFLNQKDVFKNVFKDVIIEIKFIGFVELLNNVMKHLIDRENNDKHRYSSFYKKINILMSKIEILEKISIFNEVEFKNKVNDFFQKNDLYFEQRVSEVLISYGNKINEIQNPYENDLKTRISDLKIIFDNHKGELDALLGDVKLYQDKMTNKAVGEMSAHYYEKSKFERNSYFAITLFSALIIIFSVISAYIGVNSYYNEYVSTKSCDSSKSRAIKINGAIKEISFEECMKDLSVKREATQKYAFNYLIFRLSFSLLLFLAVIYASRIAMRAYNHWRQSENMYLKLNTLSPFIGSLDKSVRNDVHLSLVPDYFGKDAGMVENSKDAVKDIPTNISNIAIKAIEQAGSTIGSKLGSDKDSKKSDSESSTEKNKKKSADDPE
ncbi:hypothetical protein E2R16_14845 [Acinetobacter seifertii]|uniref:Uncharacterized protein n=1 Tax=Acinetobacter seifertii TaxID=1530123 RepID=A0A5E9PCX4_9GAMM|nr:hypothetical protein [Acinetobacter seifertii]TEU26360.1 hypothetical protein E2R16_14845 [Acinetobacter seifertii]